MTISPILTVTLRYALIPVIFTIVGAAAGAYWPGVSRIRSHVLHLAAGVVFSVVAVELLPEIQRRALVWDVIWGFGAGVAAMLLADKLLDRLRGEPDGEDAIGLSPPSAPARLPNSLIAAVAIDFLLDGLLLGVGFAAGARIGILLALAEAAEQLSVGLALAGELRSARMSPPRILVMVTGLGSLVFVTAVAGATVLSRLKGGAMEVVLSFGAAALLYLVTAELLREAHEERESTSATAMFFAGFLIFLVVGMTLK